MRERMNGHMAHGGPQCDFILQVLTSVQSAMALVHSYPFLMPPEPLLNVLAQQHGQTQAPGCLSDAEMIETDTNWALLAAYAIKVCAADHFEHVSLLGFDPSQDMLFRRQAPSCQTQCFQMLSADDVFGSQHTGAVSNPSCSLITDTPPVASSSIAAWQNSAPFAGGSLTTNQTQAASWKDSDPSALDSNALRTASQSPLLQHEQSWLPTEWNVQTPSLSQLLEQEAAPTARRGYDNALVQPWQGAVHSSDDDIVKQAIASCSDSLAN